MPVPTNGGNSTSTSSIIDANSKDFHDIFRFSAKIQFAEALCKLDPIPLDRVQLLLESCTIPSDDILKFERSEYQHAVSMLLVCMVFIIDNSSNVNFNIISFY